MTIEKLNPWVAMVTNVGVLLGVVFLVLELNQNTSAIKTQNEYNNVSQWSALTQMTATSPEIADILVRGSQDISVLTPAEQVRYRSYMSSLIGVLELTFYSIRSGRYYYDEASIAAIVQDSISSPGARTYWEGEKHYFSSDFVEWVDEILEQTQS